MPARPASNSRCFWNEAKRWTCCWGQIESLYTAPRFKARDAAGTVVGERQWTASEALGHDGAIAYLADFLREQLDEHRLVAVGHRVVHGGLDYAAPVRLTAEIVANLEQFIPLAPLHQPHNLKPIRLLLANRPELPQVACFDTAFHRHQPEVAQAFALPPEITERGVRRYGFHGLSYEYIASVLPRVDLARRRTYRGAASGQRGQSMRHPRR